MSRKKKKKSQRRGKQVLRASSQSNSTVSVPRPAVSRLAPQVEFNPDYSYILKDLKRIATLAGSFLVILIVLSFFL